jgi:transcriptional regulator with XRE-family HTH domain
VQDTQRGIRIKSDRFRELAARRNETIDDVARASGMDRCNLYRLLRGEHTPTIVTRRKLLAHFETDFDTLFLIVPRRG